MGKETAETPSVTEQANAQLDLNKQTSLWNQYVSMINQSNPYGASTWSQGTPMAMQGQSFPTNPAAAAAIAPATIAKPGVSLPYLRSSDTFNTGARMPTPAVPAVAQQPAASAAITQYPPQFSNTQTWNQQGMDLFNQVYNNYKMPTTADLAAQSKALEDATYNAALARIQPQMREQAAAFQNTMATHGIPVGGELYNRQQSAMDKSNQESLQQLALAAMQAGKEEQNRLFNLDLAGRNFQQGLLGQYAANVPGAASGSGGGASSVDLSGLYQNKIAEANAASQKNSATLGTLGSLGGIGLNSLLSGAGTAAAATPFTIGGAALGGTAGSTLAAGAGGATSSGLLAGLGTVAPWALLGLPIAAALFGDD